MPVDPFDERHEKPPNPAGLLIIVVLMALSWLLYYALSHGWFKTIPI